MWPKRWRRKKAEDAGRTDRAADFSKAEDLAQERSGETGEAADAFGRDSRDARGRRRYGWRPEPRPAPQAPPPGAGPKPPAAGEAPAGPASPPAPERAPDPAPSQTQAQPAARSGPAAQPAPAARAPETPSPAPQQRPEPQSPEPQSPEPQSREPQSPEPQGPQTPGPEPERPAPSAPAAPTEPAADRTPAARDSEAPAAPSPEAKTTEAKAPEPKAPDAKAPEPKAPDPAAQPAAEAPAQDAKPKRGWLTRLREGLSRSSGKIGEGIGAVLTKRKLDDEALEELEEVLISADLGVQTSAKLVQNLAKERFNKNVDADEVRGALAADVEEILAPVARPLDLDAGTKPHVVLVVGVNGSGKTTTIGKLAKQYKDQGKTVHLAAGDTFRAAAVEQLQIWGQRTGCPVTAKDTGADAAGLAYDALQQAQKDGADLLLIDTAGRLHNKQNLMAELQKVQRVLQKLEPTAPHDVLLVLDATTGQNAVSQVQTFKELVDVTGLAVTKLDGSARGGVLVALAEQHGLPVHAVGVGETADDLRPFDARSFSRALMGLDPAA